MGCYRFRTKLYTLQYFLFYPGKYLIFVWSTAYLQYMSMNELMNSHANGQILCPSTYHCRTLTSTWFEHVLRFIELCKKCLVFSSYCRYVPTSSAFKCHYFGIVSDIDPDLKKHISWFKDFERWCATKTWGQWLHWTFLPLCNVW